MKHLKEINESLKDAINEIEKRNIEKIKKSKDLCYAIMLNDDTDKYFTGSGYGDIKQAKLFQTVEHVKYASQRENESVSVVCVKITRITNEFGVRIRNKK